MHIILTVDMLSDCCLLLHNFTVQSNDDVKNKCDKSNCNDDHMINHVMSSHTLTCTELLWHEIAVIGPAWPSNKLTTPGLLIYVTMVTE